MLESAAEGKWGRYSIYTFDPVRTLSIAAGEDLDPLKELGTVCRPWGRYDGTWEVGFVGGWIGYVAYEAGRFIEPTAGFRRSPEGSGGLLHGTEAMPIGFWSLYDTVVVHNCLEDRWLVAGAELPPRLAPERPGLMGRLAGMQHFVETTGEAGDIGGKRPAETAAGGSWNYSTAAYLEKVVRLLEYIRAGDVFQVNLSRRFRIRVTDHPFEIYERLCKVNPATYAAYLPVESAIASRSPRAILSSSPELFLSLQGGTVVTRPIKGTRPRGRTVEADSVASRALAESEKDRAELNMIIDLERNDLGRVCEFGTVRVVHEGEIEKLPTVFHRTATVTGRLRGDADAIDLLRAAFPGGSVTGAPKVRAMQIINELEPHARGPYCGALGYIGLNGDMMLNLPIRTMAVAGGRADVMVGSGIVADSDPQAEYEELAAKAAGMLRAVKQPADAYHGCQAK
jgi:para-aminobenzoate synthetase component 1